MLLSIYRMRIRWHVSKIIFPSAFSQGRLIHLKKHKEKWTWSMPQGYDTGIKVKNSYLSTKKLVPLIVKDPNYVTWYACGPTVYDHSHVGHGATYLHFDMIRRILTKYFGLNIAMVMGITNMDNKIINRALLYDKGFMEIADTYESTFMDDMKNLNILPPTSFLRVTDVIPHIVEFIQDIINKNQAYVTGNGNVYFDYNSAHQSIAKLMGEYFEPDISMKEKRFEKDVSLWKTARPGEPYWDSPWGKGRPGWHIECSVIASMCFGNNIDIHTGATDLRFPHHEYEVAQCDAYHGCQQWVNYFLHTGHVKVAGDVKMSKSLGNFVRIVDFLNDSQDPDILRLLCAHNKYTKNFKISDKLSEVEFFFTSLTSLLKQCEDIGSGRIKAKVNTPRIEQAIQVFEKGIIKDFQDDFNISQAFTKLRKLMKQIETGFVVQDAPSDVVGVIKAIFVIENFLDNLGFTFHKRI